MKSIKSLLKITVGIIGLFVVLIIVLLSGERYETAIKNSRDENIQIEIKKYFGRKISECPLNSGGFYHGPSKSWYLFKGTLKSEGNYNNGYWHGRWNDYDRNGQLMMMREFNMGVPVKVFVRAAKNYKELSQDEWPKYLEFKQSSPQRVHE